MTLTRRQFLQTSLLTSAAVSLGGIGVLSQGQAFAQVDCLCLPGCLPAGLYAVTYIPVESTPTATPEPTNTPTATATPRQPGTPIPVTWVPTIELPTATATPRKVYLPVIRRKRKFGR
jgi:hypothetical protein